MNLRDRGLTRETAGDEGRREMEISASSVSLFDVATCPKLGSIADLPPSPSGSAGIKESALGLTGGEGLASSTATPLHSRRCSALHRQPAKFLSGEREEEREKKVAQREGWERGMRFRKIRRSARHNELLFGELGDLEESFLPHVRDSCLFGQRARSRENEIFHSHPRVLPILIMNKLRRSLKIYIKQNERDWILFFISDRFKSFQSRASE